jgi:hypothetical protein
MFKFNDFLQVPVKQKIKRHGVNASDGERIKQSRSSTVEI